jgi:hypothetical protein
MAIAAYYHKMKVMLTPWPLWATLSPLRRFLVTCLQDWVECESLVSSITTRGEPISLTSFFTHLLSVEVRIQCNASVSEIQSSANVASQ